MKNYSNEKITRNIDIDAKCIYENCLENITKIFRQLCKTGCYCEPHMLIIGNEKKKETNIKLFGVPFASQSPEIKDKTIQTCLINHGVPYVLLSKVVKEKGKKTLF